MFSRDTGHSSLQPPLSRIVVLIRSMYSLAINELLSRFDTALAPDIFKLPQIRMLIIATLIVNGSYSIDKTDLAAPPLLIARLPLVHTVKDTTRYDRDSRHARRLGQHR